MSYQKGWERCDTVKDLMYVMPEGLLSMSCQKGY